MTWRRGWSKPAPGTCSAETPRDPSPRCWWRRRPGAAGQLPVFADVPARRGHDALSQAGYRRGLDHRGRGQARAEGVAPGARAVGLPGLPRRLAPAAAGAPAATGEYSRGPGGQRERPVRGTGPAEERQHRRRRQAADVPGHRHRHRHRQEGPARLGRGRRGGGDLLRRPPHLYRDQPALLADGAAVDVRGGEHRQQPAGRLRDPGAAGRASCRRVPPDVRAQGRWLGEQDLPVPADKGGAERAEAAGLPRGEDQDARDQRLPALSPGDRDRRHHGGDHAEDGEAGLDAVSRRVADGGQQGGARDPRPQPGSGGAQADAEPRHRGAVRRQVFLPRCPRDPAAAAWREPADRHRGFVQRGPADQGEDHAGGHLPRAARA